MKKIALVLVIILALFTLTGCSGETFPYVKICRTIWTMDNLKVVIPPNLILDESMPYRFDYDTNTLTIYFVKENL